MSDLFQKCFRYKSPEEAKALGIYPYFRALETKQDTRVRMDGKERIMLGSNNYLGLTSDPRVIRSVQETVGEYGSGCSGSRFLNGTLDLHLRLEEELAAFLNKEACVSFSTGFQSNLAIISAITDRNDVILSDTMNHASIVDGTRLSFARTFKYRHADMADLEEKAKMAVERGQGGILIVTDGVFSMEGDIAKLPEIVSIARRYGARVLVDDAHGLGILGRHGRGTAEYFGLEEEVDLIMNTFSKTLASLGGCVVGKREVVEFIRHTARPFIFSASIPPAQVAAARKALRILQEEPWRIERLHEITRKMKELLRRNAVPIYENGNQLVPIIPIQTGDLARTLYLGTALYEGGVYVNPVLPPAVAPNACLLRTSYMATHRDEDLEEAVGIIARTIRAMDEEPEILDRLRKELNAGSREV